VLGPYWERLSARSSSASAGRWRSSSVGATAIVRRAETLLAAAS
jgi:hypothetical protein